MAKTTNLHDNLKNQSTKAAAGGGGGGAGGKPGGDLAKLIQAESNKKLNAMGKGGMSGKPPAQRGFGPAGGPSAKGATRSTTKKGRR